jgi:hypothetical protein
LATLTITDVDGGGEILITSPMAEANLKGTHPIQNLGAVETYNRRYLWMAAMEIVEHDILDASKPLEEKATPVITPNQGAREEVSPDELPYLEELAAELHRFACKAHKTPDSAFYLRVWMMGSTEPCGRILMHLHVAS